MIALSGAAFAQDTPVPNTTDIDADFTIVNDNTNINQSDSLLTQILNQATDVQISMTNAAENLANLDGSINVLESANVDEMLAELTASVSFGDSGQPEYTWTVNGGAEQVGTFDQYQAAVNAIDANISLTSVTAPAAGATDDASTPYDETKDIYVWVAPDGTNQTGNLEDFNAAVGAAATTDTVTLVSVTQGDLVEGIIKGVSRTADTTTAIDFYDPAVVVDSLQTDIANLSTTVIGALNTGVIGQNGGDTGGIAANTLMMANMAMESVAQTTGSLANSAEYFQPGDLQLANLATNMATVVDASVNVDQLMANVSEVSTTLIGALNTGDIATDVNQNASNLTQALVGQ